MIRPSSGSWILSTMLWFVQKREKRTFPFPISFSLWNMYHRINNHTILCWNNSFKINHCWILQAETVHSKIDIRLAHFLLLLCWDWIFFIYFKKFHCRFTCLDSLFDHILFNGNEKWVLFSFIVKTSYLTQMNREYDNAGHVFTAGYTKLQEL